MSRYIDLPETYLTYLETYLETYLPTYRSAGKSQKQVKDYNLVAVLRARLKLEQTSSWSKTT